MNPISLLCEIIEQVGKVSAQAYRDDARYGALLDAGLIRRDGVVQSLLCDNCDNPHDADVVFESGSYGHYCPDLGFIPSERAELVAVRPNFPKLMKQLHAAFGCQPGSMSKLGLHTWRIGLADTPGGRAVVYFHPCLRDQEDLEHLGSSLRAEIRRDYVLIVTVSGQLQYHSAKTCDLPQMVHLDTGGRHIRQLVSVAEAVGAPPKQTGGRPNLHGERICALLAERVANGLARDGRNEEAKAISAIYSARFPNDPTPKLPTIKGYVSKYRRG